MATVRVRVPDGKRVPMPGGRVLTPENTRDGVDLDLDVFVRRRLRDGDLVSEDAHPDAAEATAAMMRLAEADRARAEALHALGLEREAHDAGAAHEEHGA